MLMLPPFDTTYNLAPAKAGVAISVLDCDVEALSLDGWELAEKIAPAAPKKSKKNTSKNTKGDE